MVTLVRRPSLGIYIPTRGRVGYNRQATLREFLTKSDARPVLVCPEEEVASHQKYYKGPVRGCPLLGIGPTRQWILENSTEETIAVVSDDIRFYCRPSPTVVKLGICEDLRPLLRVIQRAVDEGFIHGGVGARQGNNQRFVNGQRARGVLRWGHLFVDCERVNDFHFFHRRAVLSTEVRFDALTVMEDFHATLSLLTQGYANTVIHNYVWNQEASGKSGGCSLYRTAQVQAEGAEGLAQAFPRFVKVVEKTSKDTSPSWREFKTRKDVVVAWWQAYRSSGVRHPLVPVNSAETAAMNRRERLGENAYG